MGGGGVKTQHQAAEPSEEGLFLCGQYHKHSHSSPQLGPSQSPLSSLFTTFVKGPCRGLSNDSYNSSYIQVMKLVTGETVEHTGQDRDA